MGSRTSVPPKSTSSGHASTARNARPSARSSVPPTSAAARTSHAYGGSRSYTSPSPNPKRPSSGGKVKWIVLVIAVLAIASVVACVFLLGGSQPEESAQNLMPVAQTTASAPAHTSVPTLTPTATSTASPVPASTPTSVATATPAPISASVLLPDSEPQADLYRIYSPDLRWYVQQLTTEEKALFAKLYDGIAAVETTVSVPSLTYKERQLNRVITALCSDCPELVHFNREASVSYSTLSDYVVSVTFSYAYPDKEENLRVSQQVIKEAKKLMTSTEDGSMVEREHKLYSQIVQRAAYDKEFEHCANADGVFLYGKAKCSGYAAALTLACRLHGIPCIYVTGDATNDEGTAGHAWNYVQIDGAWYVCDATWDRVTYESYQKCPAPINSFLHYFNVTEKQISRTHKLGKEEKLEGWSLPVCNQTKASFWNVFGGSTEVTSDNWENVLVEQLNEVCSGRRQQIVLRVKDQKQYKKIAASYLDRVDEWIKITKNECSYSHSSSKSGQLIMLYDFHWMEDNPYRDSGLHVRFLDVGDADAAIVRCGNHTMLIDGGTEKSGSSKLYSYLFNNGITYVDAVVVSHPHSDHAGGLCGALSYKGCSFGTLYSSVLSSDNKSFNTLLELAAQRGLHPVVPDIGTQFQLGDALVTFLSPEAHKSYENVNNKSLVVRIDYGSVSFLFVGDAMENAELDMLASGVNLDVDVLKVAHHGADTSSGLDFLRAVSPNVAVISCGANSSDHPGTETMSRLQQTAGLVLRTDEMGEIAVFTDGSKLSYITQK